MKDEVPIRVGTTATIQGSFTGVSTILLDGARRDAPRITCDDGPGNTAARQLSESTLPAAEAAMQDLRATSKALREVTEQIETQGAGSLLGGPALPDYEP